MTAPLGMRGSMLFGTMLQNSAQRWNVVGFFCQVRGSRPRQPESAETGAKPSCQIVNIESELILFVTNFNTSRETDLSLVPDGERTYLMNAILSASEKDRLESLSMCGKKFRDLAQTACFISHYQLNWLNHFSQRTGLSTCFSNQSCHLSFLRSPSKNTLPGRHWFDQ